MPTIIYNSIFSDEELDNSLRNDHESPDKGLDGRTVTLLKDLRDTGFITQVVEDYTDEEPTQDELNKAKAFSFSDDEGSFGIKKKPGV